MIAAIKNWITERKRKREAIALARQAFAETHADEKMVAWRIPPIQIADGTYIVTVCYRLTKPPRRSWWRVDLRACLAGELPYQDASKLITIPKWL